MSKEPGKVLVVGSGGREHTLVQACLDSPLVDEVIAAPGNGGIAMDAVCHPVADTDIKGLVALARAESVGLVVVGPEIPLSLGLVDALDIAGIPAYGPNREAARLEASKAFTKSLLHKYDIPTAKSTTYTKNEVEAALSCLRGHRYPLVLKASGLAAGKGVIIAEDIQQAEQTLQSMLAGELFGESGEEVVIEEYLEGEEASITLMVSGSKYVSLPPSQDHKRIGENDTGPNTGGMGAYAPAAVVTPEVNRQVIETIIEPTLEALVNEGIDYRGTLYIGIMITAGGPKVIEFNVRFGDPETQVVLPLLESDPVALMMDCARGTLEPSSIRIKKQHAIVVVLAMKGYPGSYEKGEVISLPSGIPENTRIIHAGTSKSEDGRIVTSGGRVLGVLALNDTLSSAADDAYELCEKVNFHSRYYRRDIGARQLHRK